MEVKQIATLLNEAYKETTGQEALVNEDLSNLVEAGDTIANKIGYENYTGKLVDRIGKTIFVTRPYSARYASLRKDSWRFGSILSKIRGITPEYSENEAWKNQKGVSVDQDIYNPPDVAQKFYNKRTTFNVDLTIAEEQMESAFKSAEEMNSFLTMIQTSIQNAFEKATENLASRTVNNMIAETIYDDFGSAALSSTSGVKAVNLLYLYNQATGESLSASEFLTTPSAIRFAVYTIKRYQGYLRSFSKSFNIGETEKHTPADRLKLILLDDFKAAGDAYLESDTFHNELVKLPAAETVPYWQGSGTDFGFGSISKIDVKSTEGHTVSTSGILGVMFDEEACVICNTDKRVTTHYNARGHFFNYFHSMTSEQLNDFDENFVVFFVA